MKTVRKYVVDHHLGGCTLPDRAEPVEPFTSEEEAIAAFQTEVGNAAAEALVNGEITAERQVEIHDELQALTIGLLLGLKPMEEIACEVADRRHYLMLSEVEEFVGEQTVTITEIPTTAKTLAERKRDLTEMMFQAIKDGDVQTARDIQASIDALHDPSVAARLAAEQERAETIVALIRLIRQSYLSFPEEMGEFAKGERNGLIFGILTAARVPYAVVGEMRPSREWRSTHETVKLLAMDKGLDPYEIASWLIGLPKGEAAPPEQPDFADRPDREQVTEEITALLRPNPWFTENKTGS